MEYLYSQTGDNALQRELARDPGAEEEEEEEEEDQEDQEEDEGFLEELPGVHAILRPPPDRPAVAEEDRPAAAEEEVSLAESAEGRREGGAVCCAY